MADIEDLRLGPSRLRAEPVSGHTRQVSTTTLCQPARQEGQLDSYLEITLQLLSAFRRDHDRDIQKDEEFRALREQLRTAQIRFELAGKSEALWDMEYPQDGDLRPDTPFWWSEQFRKLVGFQNEGEFPNVLDSWGSRLHRNDKDRTFAAFAAHLKDRTGRTPYDIEYQLQMKSGDYRWFLARGYTLRDTSGNPLRVAGSLRDIHAEKLLNQRLTTSKDQLQSAITDVRTNMDALLNQAVQTAEASNSQMARLNARSAEIRKVNSIISEIAFTSNLLALNAMIEAARAGDAGSGFTVVAEEVKRLATRTASATDDVTRETHAIGEDIGQVSQAINQFQEIIQRIQQIQIQLTSTIEAQTTDLSGRQLESVI